MFQKTWFSIVELPDIEEDHAASLKFYQPAKGSPLSFATYQMTMSILHSVPLFQQSTFTPGCLGLCTKESNYFLFPVSEYSQLFNFLWSHLASSFLPSYCQQPLFRNETSSWPTGAQPGNLSLLGQVIFLT